MIQVRYNNVFDTRILILLQNQIPFLTFLNFTVTQLGQMMMNIHYAKMAQNAHYAQLAYIT